MHDHQGREWLPLTELATLLDIPPNTLHQWGRRGKVLTITVLRRTWVEVTSARQAQHTTTGRYLTQRQVS